MKSNSLADKQLKSNPLTEIGFMTGNEYSDVSALSCMLLKAHRDDNDLFWFNMTKSVLNGLIMHFFYKSYQEKLNLPLLADIVSFLNVAKNSDDIFDDAFEIKKLFAGIISYHHISPEQFINGDNILKELYGEYIYDFAPFNKYFREKGFLLEGECLSSIDDIRNAIKKASAESPELICWDTKFPMPSTNISVTEGRNENNENMPPFHILLAHPKIVESAMMILDRSGSGIIICIISMICEAVANNEGKVINLAGKW